MDNPRQPSLEARESGEKPENAEPQKLDDATFEPRSLVEQTGDYRQAESIQNTLVVLVDTTAPAQEAVTAVAPHTPGEADRSKVTTSPGEGEGKKVDAIPITVPDVRTGMDEASSLPLPIPHPKDEVSTMPIPIPTPKDEVGSLPIPIRGEKTGPALIPENDIRPEGEKSGPALIPENDIVPDAASGGEADSLPLPIPSPKAAFSGAAADPARLKRLERREKEGEYYSEDKGSPKGGTHQDTATGKE
jgi:hypothetical protein